MRYWTKQHESVYNTLMECGRYVARRDYVHMEQQDGADIMLKTYDWLFENHPLKSIRPDDAECLIWLSPSRDATMLAEEGRVIMELEIDPSLVYNVNIAKWGSMLNYSYIPFDEADLARHRKELALRGISDAKALMTPFYPDIAQTIKQSWLRLFDDFVMLGSDACYATVWELKKEWLIGVVQ